MENKTKPNSFFVQKFIKTEASLMECAIRYYTIIAAINGIKLSNRELEVVAFTAIKGNISYSTNREEFCKMYNTSSATINNIVAKLKKIEILVKDNSKIKVNPKILLDFKKPIIVQAQIRLYEKHSSEGQDNKDRN